MSFKWLKQYMPKGLYGRAALTLLFPIVLLQVFVSVIFIQRHFEDVTTQMTAAVIRELRLVQSDAATHDTEAEALEAMRSYAPALNISVEFIKADDIPADNSLFWYDFSGRVIIAIMEEQLPGFYVARMDVPRRVTVFLASDLGPMSVEFSRRRVSAAAPHQLPVAMVFFALVLTVISFIYLRNQLRPITRLADAATAFGRGQHTPYTPSGAVEVRAAGGAFVDMRARIERHIEQRTLMLSGVSHDMRTPLTRLKLGLSMIDEEDAEPLLHDVDELERLLDEFLNFAKGMAEGATEPVDPVALVRSVVSDAKRTGKDVSLHEAGDGPDAIALRPIAMRRALENLVGNAVQYGERCELSVLFSDKSVCFRVEDDGPGIPPQEREQALKPFARLDPARNQNKGGGVGLGLAITVDVARAHGGMLRLSQSERLGGLCADIVLAR